MENWFLIYTKNNKEFFAKKQLENQNFEVYLPLFLSTRRHARKTTYIKKAFFPRYLFVKLDLDINRWKVINSTLGVDRIVVFDKQPAPLPEEVINNLKLMENEEGLIKFSFASQFKVGNEVVINKGPLAGITGIYKGMSDKMRVRVLLNFMGRTLTVPLNNTWVNNL